MLETFQVATQVLFGKDSRIQVPRTTKKIAVVCTHCIDDKQRQLLFSHLKEQNLSFFVVSKKTGEPDSNCINYAVSCLPDRIDGVIAIGGGSTIDFGKALALLLASGGEITDFEFGDRPIQSVLPIYAFPTTCGSGSEVTPYAVINNSETHRKFTLMHSSLRPTQAIINPMFLCTLPPCVRLSTALDAFVHCLESILTKNKTSLIEPYAQMGLEIAIREIPASQSLQPSYNTLQNLARLGLFGGICISHSRTGLIHTLSVSLAKYANLPHGLLNASLLPYVLKYQIPFYQGKLVEVMSYQFRNSICTDREAFDKMMQWLMNRIADYPLKFSSKIMDDIDMITHRVLQDKGLSSVSHAPIEFDSIKALLEEIIYATR